MPHWTRVVELGLLVMPFVFAAFCAAILTYEALT